MRKLIAALIVLCVAAVANAEVNNNGVQNFPDKLAVQGQLVVTGTTGITLANGESINTNTDGTFDFTRNTSGTVTLTASDDNSVAAMTVAPGGAAKLTLGSASATAIDLITDGGTVTVDGTLNGVAPAGITASPATGVWTFVKDTAGTVTLTTADDDATAAMTIDPGGNATLTLGSASDTVTVAATSGIATDAVPGATATTLAIGNATATGVSICNSAACDTVTIGTNTDADTITIGESNDTTSIVGSTWSVASTGIATFPHVRAKANAALTDAAVELTKAQFQASGYFPVDTTANAVDVEIAEALDAADIGVQKIFVVTTGGTNALTVTADGAGVTTVTTRALGAGSSCEDVNDWIRCTVIGAQVMYCESFCAD